MPAAQPRSSCLGVPAPRQDVPQADPRHRRSAVGWAEWADREWIGLVGRVVDLEKPQVGVSGHKMSAEGTHPVLLQLGGPFSKGKGGLK